MNIVTTFESFGLPKPLKDALTTIGYQTPTPIQEKGIPLVMEGKDLIGIAQTGTGKTAAFGIPIVKRLIEDKDSQAVVLVPTRELAMQVYDVMRQLTQNTRFIKSWVIIGGTSMYAQARSLPKFPRLIIATPGRLMDHLQQRTFSLSNVKVMVLDEADRMLDIGFEPQIRKIFQHVPKARQTLLFSATFPKTIERLTREYMNEPARLTIGKISEPGKDIEQSFIQTTVAQKNPLLIKELNERKGSVLIFVRTKHKVDKIARFLMDEGFQADRIHGARTQGQRTRVMKDFRNKLIRILVATDVASRGLDITHIEHVINYDLPEIPEDYIHRIGRTARAGAKGQSISFLTSEDKTKWLYLSRHLNSMGMKLDGNMIKPAAIRPGREKPATEKTEKNEYDRPHRRNYDRPKFRPAMARMQSKAPSRTTARERADARLIPQAEYRTRPANPRFGSRTLADRPPPRGRPDARNDRGAGTRAPYRSDARSDRGPDSRPSSYRNDSRPQSRSANPRFQSGTSSDGPSRGRSDARPYQSGAPRPSYGRNDSRPPSRSANPRFSSPGSSHGPSRSRPDSRPNRRPDFRSQPRTTK